MTPGQIAYEAYSVAVGGASAVTGTVLPSWAGQRPDIRDAWEVAADAVLRWAGALEMMPAQDRAEVVSTGTMPSADFPPLEQRADWGRPEGERIVLPANTPQPGY